MFGWYFTGDTPSRHHERFRLSGPSAHVFDEGISSAGAVVTGRRTYDLANGWNGGGPVPGPRHCSCSLMGSHAPARPVTSGTASPCIMGECHFSLSRVSRPL